MQRKSELLVKRYRICLDSEIACATHPLKYPRDHHLGCLCVWVCFPLRHLALHDTRGEAAKIQIPLREQGVGGSNPLAPTIQIQLDRELFSPREKFASVASVGGALPRSIAAIYLHTPLQRRLLGPFCPRSARAISSPPYASLRSGFHHSATSAPNLPQLPDSASVQQAPGSAICRACPPAVEG
jgi:hypothetical protein